MTDSIGRGDYRLGADTSKLDKDLKGAESKIKSSGKAAESAFGRQAKGGIDSASRSTDSLLGRLRTMAGSGGIPGAMLGGVGLGIGLGVFSLVSRGIQAVTGFLGDSIEAAQAEEASMARLYTALRANAEGWDGNKDSVEEWLAANQRATAFADDEQRGALVALVGATKDYAKAQDLLNLSMDLARARNISLSTSADLITRVYAGNLGTLSRYGIVVKRGATSTEALAEVQKLAQGQAQTYGESNKGAADKTSAAWGDAREAIGTRLTGLQAEFDTFFLDVAEGVIGLLKVFDDLERIASPHLALIEDTVKLIREEADALGLDADALEEVYRQRLAAIEVQKQATEQVERDRLALGSLLFDLQSQNLTLAQSTEVVSQWANAQRGAVRDILASTLSIEEQADAILKWRDTGGDAAVATEELGKAVDAAAAFLADITPASKEYRDALAVIITRERAAATEAEDMTGALGGVGDGAQDGAAGIADMTRKINLAKGGFKSFWQELREGQKRIRFFIRNPDQLQKELDKIERKIEGSEKQKQKLLKDGFQAGDALALEAMDRRIALLTAKQDEYRALGTKYGNAAEAGVEAAFRPSLRVVIGGAGSSGQQGNAQGKFHSGTDFVPRTGPYILERGERVLSKTAARDDHPATAAPITVNVPIQGGIYLGHPEDAQRLSHRLVPLISRELSRLALNG